VPIAEFNLKNLLDGVTLILGNRYVPCSTCEIDEADLYACLVADRPQVFNVMVLVGPCRSEQLAYPHSC